MIKLSEQFGFTEPKSIENIEKYSAILNKKSYLKSIQRGENKINCFKITYKENDTYHFETSYFVGIDWVVENDLAIYIEPKQNDEQNEINYIQMLFDILREPENFNHLDQLCEIDFEKPSISIEQKQDLLTPLLLVQYINILKKIVQKGLKKSYYQITKNLNGRVKGKILINETIKKNHFNNKMLFNYCQYSEFGINSLENKILKKALAFAVAAMNNLKGLDTSKINNQISYIQPAFENVDSEVNVEELKIIRSNHLYKEYAIALKLAKLILKKYGYNISTTNASKINTPPFWIDMSKLFELYVFSKLKERFTQHNEVTYHKTFNYTEPDFIINSNDGQFKMVVDAKYKPRYKNEHVSTEDIRQVSGYARLTKVYDFLGVEKNKVIDCLVIYSSQFVSRQDFKDEHFKYEPEDEYVQFYKIGIKLPVQK